jgi:DNA-binding LytR/AlgR family response regulator
MTIEVLIVDDEPLAQNILEGYVQKIPGLHVVAKCKNALEAFAVLNRQHVDLVLMDINMPEISGIDFLRTLKDPPQVIFTTAYSEYAVDSYELNAVDYLLKPVSFERFLKAITKATAILQAAQPVQQPLQAQPLPQSQENILFVKSGGKLLKVDINRLWLVEGLKDYLKLHTDSGKVIVHSTMKSFEEQLAVMPNFIRVNKSYIVNMSYVTEIEKNIIRVKDQEVIIGSTFKEHVQKALGNYKMS